MAMASLAGSAVFAVPVMANERSLGSVNSASHCRAASLRRTQLKTPARPPPVHRLPARRQSNATVCALRDDAKAALVDELDGAQSRATLAELVLALEAENPTPSPTSSELLAGKWKFAYSGGVAPGIVPSPTRPIALAMYAGGFTPGTLGLSIAEMLPDDLVKTKGFRMKIVPADKGFASTATVNVELLGKRLVAQVNCDLIPESGIRLLETYKSVRISSDRVNLIDLPKELQYQRQMFITYLDDDMMIARDETGCPDIMRRNPPADGEGSQNIRDIRKATDAQRDAANVGINPPAEKRPATEYEIPMKTLEMDK